MTRPIPPTTTALAPTRAAYAVNGAPVSDRQFYRIACDPHRHVAVEACAGAGKTWMLVSRMLRALLAGAQPQEILAITFTKKAAAEMQQRLYEWLERFAHSNEATLRDELTLRGMDGHAAAQAAPRLRALYLHLLQHGRSVQVRTFHAWFAALLRAAPMQVLQDMGFPAHYSLLENDTDAIEATWQPFHAAVLQSPPLLEDYTTLVRTYGRSNIHKALSAGLAKRTEFALADAAGVLPQSVPAAGEMFPSYAGADDVQQAFFASDARIQTLLAAAAEMGRSSGKTTVKHAQALEQAVTQRNLHGVLQALLTQKSEPRKFHRNADNTAAEHAAQELALEALCVQAQQQAWHYQQRMVRLVRQLCTSYAQVKRDNGWVDMADIERAARYLLSDSDISGWIQQRLDAQVRHVLIDEFQDTNPMQWQAVSAWLSAYAGAGAGQAPSVFLVGDPKQSIYRFRRADPQVFAAAQHFVRHALGGDVLSCDHTRRNAQGVIATVNHTMLAAQTRGDYPQFRAHTTASARAGRVLVLPQIPRPDKTPEADTAPSWRDSLTTPRHQLEEQLATRECRQAAAWIQQRIQAGARAADILVMARKNDRLVEMQYALAEQGIAAQKTERLKLADAPEVQDIVALVDVLVSPTHNLSLAQALKSPLFGVDDAQLAALSGAVANTQTAVPAAAPHTSWLQWLLHHPHATSSPWQAIAQRLRQWQQWVRQQLPHDALSAIYQDGDILARYAASVPAPQRAATLERLQALLLHTLHMDGARYANAYAWVRTMRSGTGDDAPLPVRPDAVRLLTVHGAKGLEADIVLMLDTDAGKNRSKGMDVLLHWPGESPHPTTFVFLVSESTPPPSARQLQAQEQRHNMLEEYNALYVAMTRARRELVISSCAPHIANPQSWWRCLCESPQAKPLPAPPDAASAHHLPAATASATANTAPITLPTLPALADHLRHPATQALLRPHNAQEAELERLGRLGQAMHTTLEWLASPTATPAPHPTDTPPSSWLHALQHRYELSATDALTAWQHACTILHGQGAWAWGAAVQWAANEVDISAHDRLYRLDRLVHIHATDPAHHGWWVLDYKTALHPQQRADLREQLATYRALVQRLHPHETVRAAFLSADGHMHVLEDPS